MSAVVQQLVPHPGRRAAVAVDATGLAPGAIRTFFVKRAKDRGNGFTWRHWLKWTMAVEVDRQLIVAQTARHGPTHDGCTAPHVSSGCERSPMAEVVVPFKLPGWLVAQS